MKKLLFFCYLIIVSFSTYSQSSTSIDNLIAKIKKAKKGFSLNKKKEPLLIQEEYFNQTFSDYEILKENSANFRILGKNNNKTIFQITSTNGHIKGIALETNNEFGYKISNSSSLNKLVFTKTSKNKLVFKCGTPSSHSSHPPLYNKKRNKPSNRNYIGNSNTTTNPLLLESRPGATHLIYLDYDGESSLPGWETYGFRAKAFNVPDNEKRKIWEAIAEDFLPFDVNITNNKNLYDSHPELKKGWVVFADFNQPGWLGIALLGTYSTGTPVLVDLPSSFDGNHQYLYRTGSHELGHSFNLKHDGGSSGAYYLGHGEYVPIMGSGDRLVTHWSKGEYPGATNSQDDIKIINSYLGGVEDDHTDNQELIVTNTSVVGFQNSGIIETRTDKDTLVINIDEEKGDIILTVSSPIGSRSNLDIKATLSDSNGTVLQVSNPVGDRNAYISKSELPKGTYYIEIDGVGELTSSNGFSDYSSFGYYEISGNIGYISPKSNFTTKENICVGTSIVFNNISEGSENTYEWSFEGGNITTSNKKNPSITYATAGLFDVSLKTSNSKGSDIKQGKIHIGNSGIQIKLATQKLNPEFKGVIKLTDEIVSFTYSDLHDVDKENAYFDICLLNKCYEISLDNIYTAETCGESTWKDGVNYNGGDLVFYNGYIYEAKWWTNTIPTNSEIWTKKQECSSTDEGNMIQIVNTNDNSIIFETNPKEVGINLSVKKQFCYDGTLAISDYQTSNNSFIIYPNPSNNIVNITGNQIDKITIIDSLGKTITTHTINNNEFQLNTLNYSSGIYFISILSNKTKVVKKFYKI